MNCYFNPLVIRIVTMHIFYTTVTVLILTLITYVWMSIVLVHNINQSFRSTIPLIIRF